RCGGVRGAGGNHHGGDLRHHSQPYATARSARRQPRAFHRDAAATGLLQSPRQRAGSVAYVIMVQPGRDRGLSAVGGIVWSKRRNRLSETGRMAWSSQSRFDRSRRRRSLACGRNRITQGPERRHTIRFSGFYLACFYRIAGQRLLERGRRTGGRGDGWTGGRGDGETKEEFVPTCLWP